MPDEPNDQPPPEHTPTGHTVPAAKRREYFANLKKTTRPGLSNQHSTAPQNRGKGARRMQTPRGSARGK